VGHVPGGGVRGGGGRGRRLPRLYTNDGVSSGSGFSELPAGGFENELDVSDVGNVPGVESASEPGTNTTYNDLGGMGRTTQPGVPTELTPEERWVLGRMLAVWRYVGHDLHRGLVPTTQSEQKRIHVLALAAKLGVTHEYVRTLIDYPVITVYVKELE